MDKTWIFFELFIFLTVEGYQGITIFPGYVSEFYFEQTIKSWILLWANSLVFSNFFFISKSIYYMFFSKVIELLSVKSLGY